MSRLMLQFTGLSGSGKSTLATLLQSELERNGLDAEVLDGDQYRNTLCKDLGFTKEDRLENIRRLGRAGFDSGKHIVIIAAINPYNEGRNELRLRYNAKLIWLDCDLKTLKARDTKGLYVRAMLPEGNPLKLSNLTGINDEFEVPRNPDLILKTALSSQSECLDQLVAFIKSL